MANLHIYDNEHFYRVDGETLLFANNVADAADRQDEKQMYYFAGRLLEKLRNMFVVEVE